MIEVHIYSLSKVQVNSNEIDTDLFQLKQNVTNDCYQFTHFVREIVPVIFYTKNTSVVTFW